MCLGAALYKAKQEKIIPKTAAHCEAIIDAVYMKIWVNGIHE